MSRVAWCGPAQRCSRLTGVTIADRLVPPAALAGDAPPGCSPATVRASDPRGPARVDRRRRAVVSGADVVTSGRSTGPEWGQTVSPPPTCLAERALAPACRRVAASLSGTKAIASICALVTVTPVGYSLASSSACTRSPDAVRVFPMRSTMVSYVVSGVPRQFAVMWQKSRCSISPLPQTTRETPGPGRPPRRRRTPGAAPDRAPEPPAGCGTYWWTRSASRGSTVDPPGRAGDELRGLFAHVRVVCLREGAQSWVRRRPCLLVPTRPGAGDVAGRSRRSAATTPRGRPRAGPHRAGRTVRAD